MKQEQHSETKSEKEPYSKGNSDAPRNQWRQAFKRGWHDFSPVYSPNIITNLAFLLIGPIVGVIMKSPKIAVYGCAVGVCILIMMFAHHVARNITIEPTTEPTSKETTMKDDKDNPSSISQTMTNSPGGVQAGGNVTINQGAWLMSRDEQIALTNGLRAHAPAKIHVLMIGDSDSRKYAGTIAYALQDANWDFELVNYAIMMPGTFGVHVLISDPDLRATVVSALKAAGIPTIIDSKNDPRFPNAILVAHKP